MYIRDGQIHGLEVGGSHAEPAQQAGIARGRPAAVQAQLHSVPELQTLRIIPVPQLLIDLWEPQPAVPSETLMTIRFGR